ncbi:MAG: hypothetical protein LBU16_03405 [Treponema sp.]|jgi:hypothetical protein|nr:hypothetical protein [Treponema sp.]
MVRIIKLEEPEEAETQGVGQEAEQDYHPGKIYCANCIHCKLVPARFSGDERYVLRIRCAAGKWKKKLGAEKLYKYCTITRRYLDACDAYEEMGDARAYIRELRKSLPERDELYVLN